MTPEVKCKLFNGPLNNKGYGQKRFMGKNMLAHRVSFMESNPGIDISKILVLHKCDVRNCIEPKHLFLGTAKDNTMDMIKKGRQKNARGEDAGKSKLTWNQICEIRKRYIAGQNGNLKELYVEFGISKVAMLDIVKGRSWKARN